MDKNALFVLKLLIVGIVVNTLLTSGLSATENTRVKTAQLPHSKLCNETALLLVMEDCGEQFKNQMMHVDPKNWCNLTHFIWEYYSFSTCTEQEAEVIGCYWPNPQVESYIITIHKHFFSNCTLDHMVLLDPPDPTLTVLVLVPVMLTLAMVALVVWCSKRSDILV
uniref:Receptor activity-modifying protein 3 n=1 Tax=Lepisosteus oculatus TaxID=7918 RepID=W5N6X3_LEPOC|nr:PREDICTED: receptor activity-modifying protein 3 isoform X1 [Lepisosteus oculatus]